MDPSEVQRTPSGAVFVMPRTAGAWQSARGLWITVAGWAAAAERVLGASWVATPDRVASAAEVLEWLRDSEAKPGSKSSLLRRALPPVVVTAAKDARLFRESRRFADLHDGGPWKDRDLAFVWQHHDLFARAGRSFARRKGVPLVLYVHAPQVWEAARWGVRRPVWGRAVEFFDERLEMLQADLVACVSDEVAAELRRMGVPDRRILVSPMAADPVRFSASIDGSAVRRHHGLEGAFVVGWTGSFRRFHGLDLVIRAFASVRSELAPSKLLLVGDGQEREAMQGLARELGVASDVEFVFSHAVTNLEVPEYLAAMDVAVVSTADGTAFHYSPLKLREYMLCGKPTIVPRVGEMERLFEEGAETLMYKPGDIGELAGAIRRLYQDRPLALTLGLRAAEKMARTGTWEVQVRRVLGALDHSGLEGI